MYSGIQQVGATGYINQVNDVLPGLPVWGGPGGTGTSQGVPAQLGKRIAFDGSNIRYNPSVGTVYGGMFRYVKLAAASLVPVIGQILFWASADPNDYTVTTDETLMSVDAAIAIAGVTLSASVTPGYCTYIQDEGPVKTMFRAVLTDAGALGSRCFAAGAGAGADNGFADVLSDANPTAFSDVSLMLARYLGTAIEAPVGGALKTVDWLLHNYRG